MFTWFLPRHSRDVLAEAEAIQANLRRNRIYSQDTVNSRDLNAISALEDKYPPLLKTRDIASLEQLNEEALLVGNRVFPPSPWDAWRENVEVFVVAAIMALAIRTFFLQPFKIPTGSMEPTLYGIEPMPATIAPPNVLAQIYDFAVEGRTYSHVVTKQGGRISAMKGGTMSIWFEYTDVQVTDPLGNVETDRIWIRPSDVQTKLNLYPYGSTDYITGQVHQETFAPGAALANYVTQTGDQVMVDKVTYNFRPPRRGEVFIFKTAGIPGLEHERGPDQEGSEDFIKRCVGLAGDVVQVKPPQLFINGVPSSGAAAFAKEFSQTEDYPGYSLVENTDFSGTTSDDGKTQTYYVPVDMYWAMGDNSPHSKDSRYWGGVPRQNLVGRGGFVFWPFTKRWGFIR